MNKETNTEIRKGKTETWMAGVLCLALSCMILGGISGYVAGRSGTGKQEQISSGTSGTEIYEKAREQVVGIQTEADRKGTAGMNAADRISGTGCVITEDGYILTNYHVIEGAVSEDTGVNVLCQDGRNLQAVITGYEATLDLAVLKVDAKELTPVTTGDSDAVHVGDEVYTVGNSLGDMVFAQTKGTVSSPERVVTASIGGEQVPLNVFQMDIHINAGASGSPVYNSRGEVVGIVTAKYVANGLEGLGFALPVNDAMKAAQEMIREGGIPDPAGIGAEYNDPEDGARGAVIDTVVPGGCADQAGVNAGDIIVAVGHRSIKSAAELTAVVKKYRAGEETELTLVSSGETEKKKIVFDTADMVHDGT